MKYGNCLFWALLQKVKHGGQIKINALDPYPCVPRTAWSLDGVIWYRYAPVIPVLRPTWFQRWFPFHVLLFKGFVKKV